VAQQRAAAKRLFDMVAGGIASIVCIPLILLLAVGVCLSLRTWRAFFVQERIGLGGRRIRIIKLRTLPLDCARYARKAAIAHIELRPFTRVLRRTHLDELPQLLLVPLGRLSLVGPRPKMPDQFEPVDPAYGEMRVRVPQGCTGLWQIGMHSYTAPEVAPQYDAFYLAHGCLRLDLWILWRTALLVLGLAPPVALDAVPPWACRARTEVAIGAGIAPTRDAAATP
jgi:lipopolysaccharide/colanic/teichoic acid biosynthesis glycosyltransferase